MRVQLSSVNKFMCWAFSCFQSRLLRMLPLLLLFLNNARCGNIVNTLPGFEGPLPFKLETGYIGVEESELFYYFVESTGKPRIDPLLLYLVGGPGCSGLNGLLYQTGNAAGLQPYINLVGILSGSPHTSTALEYNSRVPYARNKALISDKFYEAAKESCNGWYYEVDPLDAKCVEALEPIAQCLGDIYEDNILEPNCALVSPEPDDELARRALKEAEHFLHPSLRHKAKDWQCKSFIYLLSFIWANDKTVQEALHVREGTFDAWSRCNLTLNDMYYKDIDSVIPYHQNLTKTGLQVLIYTGDLDMVIPHISTEHWLRFLNLTVDYSWTPWFVDSQVGGYRVVYSNTSGYA